MTQGRTHEQPSARAQRLRDKAEECRRLATAALLRGSRESYLRLASSYEELAEVIEPSQALAREDATAAALEALTLVEAGAEPRGGGV